MNTVEKPDWSERDARIQARLHLIGVCLLVLGLPLAAWIYRSAAVGADESNALASISDNTKQNEYNMERIGGKANVMATQITEGFASLWHGTRLACTLAVLSVGGSLLCFFLAYGVVFPPPRDDPRHKDGGGV